MVERLRKAIEESRAAWQGPRWRCSASLRQEIIDYARHEVASGTSVRAAARRLGVSNSMLARWLEEGQQPSTGTFRPVQVRMAVEPKQEASGGLVLVSPGGYRVEGLDVEQLAMLLSRLG